MEAINNGLVTVFLFLYVIHLIIKTKPVKESFKGVIVVLFIGIYLIIDGWSVITEHKDGLIVIGISLLLGFIFGILRGFTMKLWMDLIQNKWFRKGTWLSVFVFVIGMGLTHIIIKALTDDSKVVLSISQTLHMGISMFGSRFVWRLRLNNRKNSGEI